jgi:glycosyltransferase involved in cell wall biosynthesis
LEEFDLRTKVLAILPGLFPSTIIGVIKPLLYLDEGGEIDFRFRHIRVCRKKDINKADVIVFCRNITPIDLKFLHWALELNKKIIYEIDDNFFEIDIKTSIGRFHRNPVNLSILKNFLEVSDLVRTYSTPMLENALRFNEEAEKVNSYFDFKLIKNSKVKDGDKIKIVYATSRGQDDTLNNIFLNALKKVLLNYYDKIEVYIWGNVDDELRKYTNVNVMKFETDYNRFIKEFDSYNFDIGLAPLINDIFHRSKTNNKFREYGAMRIAGVYSNVDVYTNCIENGETGLIVNNTIEEWYDAIEKLITNSELRNTIKNKAYEKVKDEYSMDSAVNQWLVDINRVLGNNKHKKKIYNFVNLKMLIAYDKEIQDIFESKSAWIRRIDEYIVTSPHYKNIDEVNSSIIEQYDLIIYFTSFADKLDQTLSILKQFSINTIVDLTISDLYNQTDLINLINKYYDLKFVISDQISVTGKNIFEIKHDEFYHDDDNIKETSYKKNKLAYYSLNSSISKWIDIIKLYEPKNRENQEKSIYEILKRKITNKIKKIGKLYDYLILYFKINYLKKY